MSNWTDSCQNNAVVKGVRLKWSTLLLSWRRSGGLFVQCFYCLDRRSWEYVLSVRGDVWKDAPAPRPVLNTAFWSRISFFNLSFSLEFEINIDLPSQLCFWTPTAKSFPMPLAGFLPFIIQVFVFFFSKVHLPFFRPSRPLKVSRCEYKNDSTPNPMYPFGNPTSNQNIQLMRGIIQFFSATQSPGSPAFPPLHPLWEWKQSSGSADAEGNSTTTLEADLASGKLLKIHLNCNIQFACPNIHTTGARATAQFQSTIKHHLAAALDGIFNQNIPPLPKTPRPNHNKWNTSLSKNVKELMESKN